MKQIFLGFLFAILTCTVSSQIEVKLKLEELMAAYATVDLFNGSVLVTQNGQTLISKAYGFSNKKAKTKNVINSKYQIYSITKSITATVILKLVEEKKLSLNDRLSKFYPDLPNADSITIEHLLTHTSGIYSYNNDFSMPVDKEQSIIDFLKKTPLDFKPGTDWNYSNTGYFLLGFIIQKITGMQYATVVKEYVFKPLQMSDSGFDFKNLTDKKKSNGYQYIYKNNFKDAFLYSNNELFSAGGMFSTVGDLYKFHQGMQSYKIINKELAEKAYTPFKNKYGYGWFIDTISENRIISHSGGASGFRSYLLRDTKNDICVVLLCNSENSDVAAIRNKILHILFNQPYKVPRQTSLSVSQISKYEGAYRLSPQMTIYVTFENGRLTATPSGQSSSVLLPQSATLFYIDEIDGYIEFNKNKSNVFDTLVLYQEGSKYLAPRVIAKWGITGSATPNGWNGPDIEIMSSRFKKGIWIANNISLQEGEIKFRLNNDWTFNFGEGNNNNSLKKDGKNIKVTAGVYNVSLDLSNPDNPTFSIKAHK